MEVETSQRNFGTSKYDTFVIPEDNGELDKSDVLKHFPKTKGVYFRKVLDGKDRRRAYFYWIAQINRKGNYCSKTFPPTIEGYHMAIGWQREMEKKTEKRRIDNFLKSIK